MFVCKVCGTMAIEDGECCGEQRVPLDEAIGTQERLFELSGNDKAQHVLRRLKKIAESAAERVNKAEQKLATLINERDATLAVLVDFYKLTIQSDANDLAFAETPRLVGYQPTKSIDTANPPKGKVGADPRDDYSLAKIASDFAADDADRMVEALLEDDAARPQVHWFGEVLYEASHRDPSGVDPSVLFVSHRARPKALAEVDARVFAEKYAAAFDVKPNGSSVKETTTTLFFKAGEKSW